MSTKKPAKPEPEGHVHDVSKLRGRLKSIGGSKANDWNNIHCQPNDTVLWLKHSDTEGHQ
jgi:hypothetical protein